MEDFVQQTEIEALKKILETKKKAILDNNFDHQKSMENLRGISLDEADEAAMSMKNTLDELIFEHHHKELEYIERALEKIENGEYGICEMCDEPISIQRLKAKPHARFCIICREIVEKDLKGRK